MANTEPRSGPFAGTQGSDWNGYELQIPLDQIVDCEKCPTCCQRCYRYGKSRPKWQKALIVCFYLALIDIGLALIFRFSVFSDTEFYLGPADQRLIERGDDTYNLSPILCSDYRLRLSDGDNAEDVGFNAYGLSHSPILMYETSSYLLENSNISIPPDDVYIMYHYMGSTSIVTLSACSPDRSIQVHAVRSASSIQYWEKHRCCGTYSDSFIFSKCNNKDGSSSIARRYSAYNDFSGNVFFVFSDYQNDGYRSGVDYRHTDKNVGNSKPLNITMLLERHDYSWSGDNVIDYCNHSRKCSFQLGEEVKSIVVEVPPSVQRYMELQVTCVASMWGYFEYFAVIPLGIALSFVLIGAVLYGCQQQVNRLAEEGDRRRAMEAAGNASPEVRNRIPRSRWSFSSVTPLVGNGLGHDTWGGEGSDPPPSYDAVAVATISDTVGNEEPPPSYSSVTNDHSGV